jgi:hypothetical protein
MLAMWGLNVEEQVCFGDCGSGMMPVRLLLNRTAGAWGRCRQQQY